jgi:DNA-binding MarR family transcriptional regulator
MDDLKEAFGRVKEDIDFLYSELINLKEELIKTKEFNFDLKESINEIKNLISSSIKEPILQKNLSEEHFVNQTNRQTDRQTHPSTDNSFIKSYSTHPSTDSTHIKPLKPKYLVVSNGNGGVPTDRQTDRQTDQQTNNSSHNKENQYSNEILTHNNSINNAIQILDSLDNLKKEVRLKFKRLTDQEMLVFTTLYQLSEENIYTDYRTISLKLNLTESSIRDYVGRLVKKGIPVDKTKVNNKSIQLSISPNLKKVASLQTILQLREI